MAKKIQCVFDDATAVPLLSSPSLYQFMGYTGVCVFFLRYFLIVPLRSVLMHTHSPLVSPVLSVTHVSPVVGAVFSV